MREVQAMPYAGRVAPSRLSHLKRRAMKLYRTRIPAIARQVIEEFAGDGSIEVLAENRTEAETDLVAIMEEYLRRDMDLRDSVREHMSRRAVPYDRYGKVRSSMAQEAQHPTGNEVERFLARQFVENFMISRFIEEVYADDVALMKRIRAVLESYDVDESAIRDEAREKVKNLAEGTVDYEIALSHAVKEVKKKRGLLVERSR
jgi:hypothetical protein